jgi:hypothetical protein
MLLRLSMGDTGVLAASVYLTEAEQWLFYFLLLVSLILFNFIMMNYIIADASKVYTDVSEQLENFMLQEKAMLCADA